MKTVSIDLTPEEYHVPSLMRRAVARQLGVAEATLEPLRVTRRTLDCRRRNAVYHTEIILGEEDRQQPSRPLSPLKSDAPRVVVVGAGPAGLFAALTLLEHGIRPVIVERGKAVEDRRHDIVRLGREQVVDPDSNWCFGEGGAGTYSDGKLYTRSTKRGDVGAVLRTFVAHGADADIMLDAHAHIGTDRLSGIIANMRHTIEAAGGEYHFGCRVDDLIVEDGKVLGVVDRQGHRIDARAVILATGHSAREIYSLFHRRGWRLEAKPFALGVRVEHPQELINEIQYHGRGYSKYLPPAAYSLTTQVGSHGVFSFCMCPGGVIVPAATGPGQQVVNGMSNSHRNSPWANSGIAVTVGLDDVAEDDVFALLRFQQSVEERMFHAGGDAVNAPSQRLVDFLQRRPSSTLPRSGYLGHTVGAPLHELLPPFVADALREGFKDFDRRMHGFITEEAMLLAVESRTSSPVRISRDRETLQHPQLQGLYPCGEGAGYAGGIVSSALDGIRCAEAISLQR
ncbi:MAG: FAD-binding protein [Bacteroidales bacterium]|nr:FAD-binding protein [Bacteroidales bacterium]